MSVQSSSSTELAPVTQMCTAPRCVPLRGARSHPVMHHKRVCNHAVYTAGLALSFSVDRFVFIMIRLLLKCILQKEAPGNQVP